MRLTAIALCCMASAALAAETAPAPSPSGYDRSTCAQLERACVAAEGPDAPVSCERRAFVQGLLGCVDLWEAEAVCAERLGATADVRSIDAEFYQRRLELAQDESIALHNGLWAWRIAAFVGLGLALGFGAVAVLK
jgi:hypothetical protein